jgi:serine/threonine protein kinase
MVGAKPKGVDMMKAEEILQAAVEKNTPHERAAYLDSACGQDAALRALVNGLLRAHEEAGNFLEQPLFQPGPTVEESRSPEKRGTVIGPYKLLEQIGEGGFGVVFMAEQQQPIRRKVALKVLKPGMDTRQVVARFEAERQALALMDHPNIAKVLDAGTVGVPALAGAFNEPDDRLKPGLQRIGRPYFVMELVRGVPITAYCDENSLTSRERLELFVFVCQAVQHAHQKGIIHRDIKPSNVLVTLHDGVPVVKVIDFGIAKALGQRLTDKTLFTGFAQMIGTPLYMSPEQAEMSGLDVDTRSDIYSLGVLLYELLTGTTPFDKERFQQAACDEWRRIIREEEPPKPSTRISTLGQAATTVSTQRQSDPKRLSQLFRGELDWIVMKALDKDRNRRYETASALAADVQRYLNDEPVQACPPTAWYRFRKFARRNRVVLMTVTMVTVALLLGTALCVWQAIRAKHAEQKTQEELEQKKLEHERAEANFLKTLEAVDQLLTEVGQKELASMPHLEQVRRRLLEKALQFFEEFLQSRPTDPTVRFEAGMAYRRVGDIQRLLAHHQAAEQAYGQAATLLDQLQAEMPQKRVYRQELARAHYGRAMLATELGRGEDVEQASAQARTLQERLMAEDPAHAEYQHDLAQSYNQWGLFLSKSHRLAEAENVLRQAVRIMEGLLAGFPAKAEDARVLGMCYGNLAILLADIGKTREAEEVHRSHADMVARALQQFPANRDLRVQEMGAASSYGNFLWRMGRVTEAETFSRGAVRLALKLVDDFPGIPEYRKHLAGLYGNLASLLRSTGQADKAEEYLQKARLTAEKLAADFPTVPDYQSYLGGALNNLAMLLTSLGKADAARPLLEQAIEHQQAALRLAPKHRRYREYLSNHITNLVVVLGKLEVPDEDVDKVRAEAVALARGLAADYPDVVDYQSGVGVALNNRASALVKRKEWEQARPLLDEAIEFQMKAPQPNPKNTICLEYLRNHYMLLAEVLQSLERPEATKAYRDWVSTARELATVSPQPGNWKAVIEAVDKVMAFRGGDASDWFLLAVAYVHLADGKKAQQWYDQARTWMEDNKQALEKDQERREELSHLREEAAALLEVKKN